MCNFFGKVQRRFRQNRDGSVAIVFAIVLVPLCMMIALAIDYRRASGLRQGLQHVADSASLAAVTAAATGASSIDVQTAALTYWAKNATPQSNNQNSITTPTVDIKSLNGVSTVALSFSGTQKTSFASFMGFTTIPVAGASTAQSYQIVTRANGLSGAGSVWGDPHVNAADGSQYTIACTAPKWYDLLSDSGIEVNVSCFHSSYWNEDMVNQVSIVLGGHDVTFSRPALDGSGNPITTFDAGAIKVDGATQTTPLGSTSTYLGGKVTYAHMADDWPNSYNNVLTITTPIYTVQVTYGNSGGTVAITATGAGVCGVPGGIWGATLAGIDNSNSPDNEVAGPKTTTWEYERAACSTASLGPHLIK